MRILLSEEESREWQETKAREKILEETSRFPPGMKLPDGCKLTKMPLIRLSKEQKAEILRLAADGLSTPDIATTLRINGRQVVGVIQGHKHPISANLHAARQKPKVEGLQPMKPLVVHAVETPANKPTCSSCGKPLSHNKVAIGGKLYCCRQCAPKKVPVMVTKKPKPIRSNVDIDNLIVDMASKPQIEIADEINRKFGGAWLPADVEKRLADLRAHD